MLKSLLSVAAAAATFTAVGMAPASAAPRTAAPSDEATQFAPAPGVDVVSHYCCGRRVYVVVRPVYVRTYYVRRYACCY
jgi:hypothetical protein